MLRRLVLTICLALPAPGLAAELSGPFEIVNADTIAIAGQLVRLHGIRAPAPGAECAFRQKSIACGDVARAALKDLTAGARVSCAPMGNDAESRITAVCRANGYDLSEGMVYTGWARADRTVTDRYLRFEADARARRRGLWQGEFAREESTGGDRK